MKQKNQKTMKSIFVLIALVMTSVCAFSQQTTTPQRTINVSGSSKMEVTPDQIFIQVTLQEYNKRNGDKVDIETIRNQFLAACKSIGIADSNVTVQSYSGWDNNYWWYRKNKKDNPDMKASVTYEIMVNSVSKMDELVDKMDDAATQNFAISRVWYSKMEEVKKQLKIAAIKAAKDKADYLAAAVGEEVGHAITINDPGEVNVYPQTVLYANSVMKDAAYGNSVEPPMNVDFKKIKLQFEVNVVFELK